MARTPGSEPVCLRCEVTTELHAVDVRNSGWRFRGRLCETCHRELEARRRRWMADPGRDPTGLRSVRLAAGLSLRELSARTGISYSMISAVERGRIKSWDRYIERLTAAIAGR
jgi:ribosome-binding protein aMBF1 (putative translation factor)